MSCGASRSIDGLEHIGRFRRQAEIALKTGRRWQSETGVHYYRDLALRAMIDVAAEKLGPENCRYPALELLEAHDRENDGEYLETLRVYALSSLAVSRPARSFIFIGIPWDTGFAASKNKKLLTRRERTNNVKNGTFSADTAALLVKCWRRFWLNTWIPGSAKLKRRIF